MLEDSTVSIRPQRLAGAQAAKRYRSTNRRNPPLLSISNVHEKDIVQKRRMNEILLSHADTLTRSGSSKQFLPHIYNSGDGKAGLNDSNQMQMRKIDKYMADAQFSPSHSFNNQMKFHDFNNAHGHLSERENILFKELGQAKVRSI